MTKRPASPPALPLDILRFALGVAGLALLFVPGAASAAEADAGEGAEVSSGAGSEPAAALRKGRYAQAIEGFQAWASSDPDSVPAVRGWAEALAAQGKLDEALERLRGSRRHATSPELQCAEGRIHLVRGALKEAEASFRAALNRSPDCVEALNRLGEALVRQGKKQEAQASWNRLVALYERMGSEEVEALRAEDFVEMALALIGLNRWGEANDVMIAQAKEKDEGCPSALLESGRALLEKYNYPDSRFELRAAIDENPWFADALVVLAKNQLADFQLGTERFRLAEKYLDRALAVNPRHAEALSVRGSLWLSDGNVDRAAEDLESAVRLDPSSLEARGLLATCHYLRGDSERLGAAESEALGVNPAGALFFHTIAVSIERKFRYADCVRYCDRALQVDPEFWPAYVTLAINCLRTGEEARGREALERSWRHDRFNVWVFNTRMLLEHMDKEFRELRTDRLVFKFPKQDYDVLQAYLAPLMEKAYDRLSANYGIVLTPPIHIEAFSDHKWFSARTVGLEGLAAAGACFGKLVTLATPRALPQNWGAVSWHEFAHVVTLAASRQRVPRWLTEGCSVFEEGRDHPAWSRVFEREIADAWGSGRLLPIAELDFGFSKPKYPNQILISYFQGCLIVRYVSDRWGFDAIRKMLAAYGEDKTTPTIFRDVLGVSLEEFDRDFFAFVETWVAANGYEPQVAQDAIPRLEAAVEAAPGDVRKLLDLAWAYHCNRIRVDVPLTVNKVFAIQPDQPDAHAILGLEYRAGKKDDKAREHLEKAVAGGTRFQYRAHAALGEIAAGSGDKKAAIEHLEKAKAASPRAGATFPPGRNLYYRLAALYEEQGDKDRAVLQMEELSRFAPEDAACRKRIFDHHGSRDDAESLGKAVRALDELVYINPFDPAIHRNLAAVAVKAGAHDVAIREYGYLLSLPDTDRKAALVALAESHLARGDRVEAAKLARQLQELDPASEKAARLLERAEGAAEEPVAGERVD